MNEIPLIEYQRHPAFLGFQGSDDIEDSEISDLIREIDSAFIKVRNSFLTDQDQLRIAFDKDIAPRLEDLCNRLVRSVQLPPSFKSYVTAAIEKAKGFLYAQLEFDAWKNSIAVIRPAAISPKRVECMRRDGFFKFQADGDLAGRVWAATAHERSLLRERARQRSGGRCATSLHPSSSAVRMVRDKLKIGGVLELASAYMGCAMEWIYCALEFSHEAQRWYRDCYIDHGLSTVRTVYMHLDADTEMIKAMLYLQDVSEEQGPFRFVQGSPRWRRSPCLISIHKGFDTVENDVFEMEPDRLDYKLGYYRPRFKLPEYRRNLMALPAPLRGTTHFGDDILDQSALSSLLLSEEVTFTGPAGTLLVFDGSAGVHRGGQVTRGERWAVQIAMRAVRNPKRSLQTAIHSTVESARYRAHLMKRWLKRHLV